jgi:NAD+ kinase
MKIAIFGRLFSDEHKVYVQHFFDRLDQIHAEILIYEPFLDFLAPRINVSGNYKAFTSFSEIEKNTQFFVSFGGDGTFLDATTFVRDSKIPIIGINTGRLGFLSSIAINEVDSAINAILNNNFLLDDRTLLKVEDAQNIFGDINFALNELTVHKKESSSMITIHTYLNDVFLNSYWADGLIVATPTGSTAYSLSCGGPIILPGSDCFQITPIAPHNLNVRPMVIPDSSKLTLKVEGRSKHFLVSLDSRSVTTDSSLEITISKNNFKITRIMLPQSNHLSTIRTKLNWGLDKRN